LPSSVIDSGTEKQDDREGAPSLAPFEEMIPALDWAIVSRDAPQRGLDLAAIAAHAAALGRVAGAVAEGSEATLDTVAFPVPTNLSAGEDETTAKLDPQIAGAVSLLTGALVLHSACFGRPDRRRPAFQAGCRGNEPV
jgi:hypothetical protein